MIHCIEFPRFLINKQAPLIYPFLLKNKIPFVQWTEIVKLCLVENNIYTSHIKYKFDKFSEFGKLTGMGVCVFQKTSFSQSDQSFIKSS